jgi:hypothetical protein
MFNCSEHCRVWLDGRYVLGSQPSLLFPTQHRPPAGQGIDIRLSRGQHRIVATILKPPAQRDYAEWVVAFAEHPALEWVPAALRPH